MAGRNRKGWLPRRVIIYVVDSTYEEEKYNFFLLYCIHIFTLFRKYSLKKINIRFYIRTSKSMILKVRKNRKMRLCKISKLLYKFQKDGGPDIGICKLIKPSSSMNQVVSFFTK